MCVGVELLVAPGRCGRSAVHQAVERSMSYAEL